MIESGINIHPIFPLWAISVGSIFLLSFLIWKELNRKAKFLAWRIAAVIFLLVSILGLILQPSLQKEVNSQGVVLLTAHYEKEIADSLRKVNDKLMFLRTPESLNYPRAEVISTLSELSETNIQFVVGDGLPYHALEEVKGYCYLKGKLPTGIVQLVTPHVFKINQLNIVSGLFRSNGKSKIKLISPRGVEDSVEFVANNEHSFELSLTPRQSGLFVYTLEVHDGKDIISQRLPVEVKAIEKLTILFIQNYPTAEAKYLKNFLIEQGHGIVSRSQLSKNNYRYEYANHDQLRIDRLSLDLLNSFDLLLTDNETLASFNKAEKSILEESVRNGLGIVQLFNSINKKNTPDFLSIPIMDFPKDTVRMKLGGASFTFSTLPVTIKGHTTSIVQTKERVLSGFLDKGAGKIGFQFLQETYRLILQGKSIEYALLWSPLIERTARFKNQSSKVQLENAFPIYSDEPIRFSIIASKNNVKVKANAVTLPLREDIAIDNYFHGKTWAGKSGWHEFTIEEDSISKNYYVSDANEWQSLRITQQQKVNELISKRDDVKALHSQIRSEQKPISPLFFFIVFLVSAGFLWLAPKI